MLSKEAIEEISSMSAENETFEHDGILHSIKKPFKILTPELVPLSVNTLSGLVGLYSETEEGLIMQVDSPRKVTVMDRTPDNANRRFTHCIAIPAVSCVSGVWLSHEKMMLKLQCEFEQDEKRDSLMKAISHIRIDESNTIEDNGLTQSVNASKGTFLADKVELPNPVTLKPFDTFPEISLFEKDYILRVRDDDGDVSIGLFGISDFKWEREVSTKIMDYLVKGCPKVLVIS